MYKIDVEYTDFNGEPQEETLYFNLTSAEFVENEEFVRKLAGYSSEDAIKQMSTSEMVQLIKRFVLLAYGERSEDGKRFIKSEKISEEFSQTAAYSALFMQLISDSDMAQEFVDGVCDSALTAAQKMEVREEQDKARARLYADGNGSR